MSSRVLSVLCGLVLLCLLAECFGMICVKADDRIAIGTGETSPVTDDSRLAKLSAQTRLKYQKFFEMSVRNALFFEVHVSEFTRPLPTALQTIGIDRPGRESIRKGSFLES